MTALLLTPEDLVELTGYRQRRKQLQWLSDKLRIVAPLRADGLPIVSRAQVEAALAGQQAATAPPPNGPKWKTALPA